MRFTHGVEWSRNDKRPDSACDVPLTLSEGRSRALPSLGGSSTDGVWVCLAVDACCGSVVLRSGDVAVMFDR